MQRCFRPARTYGLQCLYTVELASLLFKMAGSNSEDDQRAEAVGTDSETSTDPLVPVLRINQLDALELDSSLEQLLWTQFSQCFQHCRPGLLTPLEPELRALLHLLLWRFTLYNNSASVGQSLLTLRYHGTLSSSVGYKPLSPRQKIGLALLTTGPRWLQERSHSILHCLGLNLGGYVTEGNSGLFQLGLRKCLSVMSGIVQLASLINFLTFLRKGHHPILAERLVGCRPVFSKSNVTRDISYQYMNRELLWHGFAEFLIFLVPLISTKKIKTIIYSGLFRGESTCLDGGGDEEKVWKECALCGEWPTQPHRIGCQHVFCYYCIKSHSIANTYITCPRCGVEAGQLEPVKMEVEILGS